jgi:hypothetical protein
MSHLLFDIPKIAGLSHPKDLPFETGILLSVKVLSEL